MARFGGADEVVVRAIEFLHHGLEARHVALDQLARRQVLLGGGLQHLDAMLVGAGEKIDIAAVEPHEAGNGIGGDGLVSVADMRRAVRIGDRGGDVIGLAGHRIERSFSAKPWGWYHPRVPSASKPKTLKTSGLRSRL